MLEREGAVRGVDVRTGAQRWRMAVHDGDDVRIAGDLVALERGGAAADYSVDPDGPVTVSVIDPANGRRLWKRTADRLRVTGSAGSYKTAVSRGLVAVSASTGNGLAYVLVYRADSGKRVGRFPGYLAGLGDRWVAITHSGEDAGNTDRMKLDYIVL